jgi:Cu/Ag efflux protein CusF
MKSLVAGLTAFVVTTALLGMAPTMASQGKLHSIVGQVKKVDSGANTVTVSETKGKKEKEKTFHLAPQASITRNGEKVALADLKEGDRVTVHYASEKGTYTAHSISLGNPEAKPAKPGNQ